MVSWCWCKPIDAGCGDYWLNDKMAAAPCSETLSTQCRHAFIYSAALRVGLLYSCMLWSYSGTSSHCAVLPKVAEPLGCSRKKPHPPGGRQSIFFREGGRSFTAHFRGVYWPDSTHIPGWVVFVLSFYSGVSVSLNYLKFYYLLFKMANWIYIYNIILPHEGEIVLIYLAYQDSKA